MGCYPGPYRRILDKARIHKYTYTNHVLSALNIKYYNFSSNLDTSEFLSGNIHLDAKAIHSMIQGQHFALRCCPQKRSMPTGSPSMRPTIESGPLTDNRPQHHRKGEKHYLHTFATTKQSLSNYSSARLARQCGNK
jgi:hypothetical protein